MKTLLTVTGLLLCSTVFGQNCFCSEDTMLSQIISCDTVRFDNHAKLYWSFNCDSSWLTFESPAHKNEIIFSLGGGFISLTGRLGLIYAAEYRHTFLMRNNVISGCCDPPEYFLYDKETGKELESLGRILFYDDKRVAPVIVSITGSGYDTTASESYDSLTIYNIDKRRKYFIKLPNGGLNKVLEQTDRMFPELLFDEPLVKGDTLALTYLTDNPKNFKERKTETIKIDLKKYNR